MFRSALTVLLGCGVLFAQQQPPPANPVVKISGVQTPWDAKTIVDGLIRDNQQFQPVLENMHPQEWVQKGASPVYVQQWQQAQQQLRDVINVSKVLSQKPEQLSLALDDYFRLEALDVTARSLEEAIRRYADRASADRLAGLLGRNFSARQQFRDYLQDLARSQEQSFKVADEEAQRCRGMISREPAAKKTKK